MRLLVPVFLVLVAQPLFADIYRGRVQYASSGKPLGNVVVEATTRKGINVFFWVPWDPTKIIGRATTAPDGTFQFDLSERGRVRFGARGFYMMRGEAASVPEIIARTNALNIIKVPNDFKRHPKPPTT